MRMDRRSILKSMALGGVAGLAMGGVLPALAAPLQRSPAGVPPVLALVTPDIGSAFVQGIQAATGSLPLVRQVGQELGFLLDFERLLRDGQPLRVVGLLDDAAAVLVVDLARSAGARMHWLGQHVAPAGPSLGSEPAGQWATHIGYRLGSPDGVRPAATSRLAGNEVPRRGSYVSFSIQA